MGYIYIVTSGDYEDYAIRRVFLDKGEADIFVARYNDDPQEYGQADIETYWIAETAPRKCQLWTATWYESSNETHERVEAVWSDESAKYSMTGQVRYRDGFVMWEKSEHLEDAKSTLALRVAEFKKTHRRAPND